MKKILLLSAFAYLLLAPFTYHPDTKLTLSYPSLNKQVRDVYRPQSNFPPFHYPPLHFLVLKTEFILTKLVTSQKYVNWLITDNTEAVKHSQIYRFNLISKSPLLILVLISGYLIFRIVKKESKDEKRAKIAALIWLFNPITLYSAVMMGQNDIVVIAAFLLGLLFYQSKPKLAFLIFGLAGSIKTYPLIWAVLAAFSYPKSTLAKKIKLAIIPIVVYLVTLLPFISQKYFRQNMLFSGLANRMFIANFNLGFQKAVLINPLLLTILLFLTFHLKNKQKNLFRLLFSANLIILGFSHFHPQWFLWLMPFWAIIFSLELGEKQKTAKNLLMFSLIFLSFAGITMLFNDKFLQWGIVSPLNPNILNLPLIKNYLDRAGIDTILINNLLHSILAGLAIYSIIDLLKKNDDKSPKLKKIRIKLPRLPKKKRLIGVLLTPTVILTMFFAANLIPTIQKSESVLNPKILYLPLEELKEKSYRLQIEKDHLYRLEILLKNPNLISKDQFTIKILKEGGELIIQRTISAYNIGDPGYFRIDIPITASSKKQNLLLTVNDLKINDGKLKMAQMPQNNTNMLVIDQYFKPPFSLSHSITQTYSRFQEMVKNQPEVLLILIVIVLF